MGHLFSRTLESSLTSPKRLKQKDLFFLPFFVFFFCHHLKIKRKYFFYYLKEFPLFPVRSAFSSYIYISISTDESRRSITARPPQRTLNTGRVSCALPGSGRRRRRQGGSVIRKIKWTLDSHALREYG